MIRVIGFCDLDSRPAGPGHDVLFRRRDTFTAESPPAPTWLKNYAVTLGYWSTGKPGSSGLRCDPVYVYLVGHAHEHAVAMTPGHDGRS